MDQVWRRDGLPIYKLNTKMYDDWVVDAPSGSKPWVVMLGNTNYGGPLTSQPAESLLKTFYCTAKHLGDKFNFGIMDYRREEKAHAVYDLVTAYGKQAPYVIVFDEGTAYHMRQSGTGTQKLLAYLEDYKTLANVIEPIRYSRDEATIYWEYAKYDVGKNRKVLTFTKDLEKKLNNTWVGENILEPYFGTKLYPKKAGQNVILFVFLPTALLTLYITWQILKCTVRFLRWILCCCCRKKAEP